MQSQVWEFVRLLWAEWKSGVTGPTSAVLFVVGLVAGMAGVLGVELPAAKITLPLSWVVAVVAGFRSAYAVWSKERTARLAVEKRLSHAYGISFGFQVAHGADNEHNCVEIQLEIKNRTGITLSWYGEKIDIF